jgi:hypothetical protein
MSMKRAICFILLGLQSLALAFVGWLSWDSVHWQGAENFAMMGSAFIGLPLALVSTLVGFVMIGMRQGVPARFRVVFAMSAMILPILSIIFATIGAQG